MPPFNASRVRDALPSDHAPSTRASTYDYRSKSPRQLLSQARVPLSDCDEMRRDVMIAFGLTFVKSFIVRAPWRIKGANAQRNAFIDGALRRIYGRFILQYCNSLDYGFSAMCKRFEKSDAPRDWTYIDEAGNEQPVWTATAQPVIWRPFVALNPHRSHPHFDDSGNFDGITYGPTSTRSGERFPFEPGGGEPNIGLAWSLWATNEKDSVFGSLFGYPRLGYCRRFWWAYWYRFTLADRAYEKWADPPVIVYHPTDVALDASGNQRNFTGEALSIAERLRSGANVSLPSGVVSGGLDGERSTGLRQWDVQQLKSEVDFTALNDAFEYLDVAKLRAVLVPEQALIEGKGGTSSRNVASELGDQFEASCAVLKGEIDDHINRYLIPQLLEANFGPGGATCEIETTGFDHRDVETARAIVQALAQQSDGARLDVVDMRETLSGLGIPLKSPAQMHAETMHAAEDLPDKPYDQEDDDTIIVDGKYVQRRRVSLVDSDESDESDKVEEAVVRVTGKPGLIERLKGKA